MNLQSPRTITLQNIIDPEHNSNLICNIIIMIKLYTKYHLNILKHDEKKSGKLVISLNFPSPRTITLQKIIETEHNSNSICNISWYNYILNIISISRSMIKKSAENWFAGLTDRLTDILTDWRTECKPNSPLRHAGRGLIKRRFMCLANSIFK